MRIVPLGFPSASSCLEEDGCFETVFDCKSSLRFISLGSRIPFWFPCATLFLLPPKSRLPGSWGFLLTVANAPCFPFASSKLRTFGIPGCFFLIWVREILFLAPGSGAYVFTPGYGSHVAPSFWNTQGSTPRTSTGRTSSGCARVRVPPFARPRECHCVSPFAPLKVPPQSCPRFSRHPPSPSLWNHHTH